MSTDTQALEHRTLLTRKNLLFACALLIWLFFLFRSIQVFTVGSAHVTMFNSDSAIVVLMANENRPATVYNTYYYGQDRFGAWPFLIAQLIHRLTNYHWSNRGIFIIQTIWLFIGAALFSIMNRHVGGLAGLLFLLPLCLHLTARQNLFDLSQPYAWQITALVFSWWSLRRFSEYRFGLIESEPPKIKSFVWGGLTFSFALLAILSSSVSGLILIFLLALEVSRSIHQLGGNQTLKNLGKRFLQVALPIAAAVLTELLLRANYHRYSLKHFGTKNKTVAELDTGHLTENFINQWTRFSNSSWWLLSLLPLLVFALLSARYIYLLRGNKEKLRSSLGNLFLEDEAVLVIGTFGIGLINFIVTILISHIRFNDYSERYLTLSYLFISFSGLLTLPLLAAKVKKYRCLLLSAIAIASLTFLLLEFPPAVINPQYPSFQEITLNLTQKAPGNVLLGEYWETYVFAALDPNSSIIPVPAEGQTLRTPWTIEALKKADQVIIEHHRPGLGGPDSPAPYLIQYGTPLRLVTPRWYVHDGYVFSVYKTEAR